MNDSAADKMPALPSPAQTRYGDDAVHRAPDSVQAGPALSGRGQPAPAQSVTGETASGAATPLAEFETLLYHITHDLRAAARPMRVVPGWIREDLARDGEPVPARVEENLRTLETHAARLDRMLLDLRTYSRIGRMSDPPARLDLEVELGAVLADLALPPSFRVTFHIEVPFVIAPQNELRLLLNTLVGNAWKHHDRDHGRITVAARSSAGGLHISVIDDGPGIERRYRDAVFDMMTTLRPRDEIEGSGLGLSIAHKIVTGLGGTIEIAEPLAPRGTCVAIVLPQPVPDTERQA